MRCRIQDIWNPRDDYETKVSTMFDAVLTKAGVIELADELLEVRLPPRSACGFSARLPKVRQVWLLIQSIRRHGFQPGPGDEIMVRADASMTHNGIHRAAILKVLGMAAPAIAVENWREFEPIRYRGEPPWQH